MKKSVLIKIIILISFIFLNIYFYIDLKKTFKNNAKHKDIIELSKILKENTSNLKESILILPSLLNYQTINSFLNLKNIKGLSFKFLNNNKNIDPFYQNDLFCEDVIDFDIIEDNASFNIKEKLSYVQYKNIQDLKPILKNCNIINKYLNQFIINSDNLNKNPRKIAIRINHIEKKSEESLPKYFFEHRNSNSDFISCFSILSAEIEILDINDKTILKERNFNFAINSPSVPTWLSRILFIKQKKDVLRIILKKEDILKHLEFFNLKKEDILKDNPGLFIAKVSVSNVN